ncbi:unnamed protein product [Heterobilharzia americana]|nr:unnamed protein product [Heterobilharzia americana]CAH8571015.1 unnamed protein product [Heterobilharzia americana]
MLTSHRYNHITLEDWLKQLYICSSSSQLRVRKDQINFDPEKNSKHNYLSIWRRISNQKQEPLKTKGIVNNKLEQSVHIEQKFNNIIQRELLKMPAVQDKLNTKVLKFLNEIQQFQESSNCVLIDASLSDEIRQSHIITPK